MALIRSVSGATPGGANAQNPAIADYPDDFAVMRQLATNYIKLGRNYLLAAKPGYTPYTYPAIRLRSDYANPNTLTPSSKHQRHQRCPSTP